MKCPRCENQVLDEREREGVTIDSCPSCRGVWLDRGELERLVAKLSRDFEAETERVPQPSRPPQTYPDRRTKRPDESWDDDDFKQHRETHGDPRYAGGYPPRKRGFLHTLGELFD